MEEVVIVPDDPQRSDKLVIVTFKLRECWLRRLDSIAERLRLRRSDIIRALIVSFIEDYEHGWFGEDIRKMLIRDGVKGLKCNGDT